MVPALIIGIASRARVPNWIGRSMGGGRKKAKHDGEFYSISDPGSAKAFGKRTKH